MVALAQAGQGRRPALRAPREIALDRPREGPQRAPQLDRPAHGVALPERQLARLARRRLHDHPVRRDLGDAPAAGAQDDHVAVHPRAELVDHLLVQLADAPAGRPGLARDEDAVEAPVRDRAAGRDGHDAGVAPPLDRVRHAVPDQARLQLRELVRRVGARQHRQHAVQRLAGQRLERGGPRHAGVEVRDGPAVHDRHGHDLLGQHVERGPRDRRRLDLPLPHPLGDHGALQEVAAVLGEDDAAAHLVHLVPGPTDPLQPAGDRRRRLHLDHQVDRAHVDAQLQRGGRHQRGQAALLERLLDRDALLAGDRPVVGPHEILAGQLVEALGQPLREAAAVDEDERAAVALDQLQDPGVDRRPDADPPLAGGDRSARLLVERKRLAEAAHVLDRHDDLQVQPLLRPGVDDGHPAVGARAGQEAPDRLERPLRRREPDPLQRRRPGAAQVLQALQAQRKVGAPLGPGDRVDLVHDHVLDAAQRLPGARGQEEVERLRRRDEDLGRALGEGAALVGRRVAGPRGDGDRPHRRPEAPPGQGDARQRRAQVALHVVRERLQRADVQDPDRPTRGDRARRGRRADQAVQAPQERGEGLAAPRGGVQQDVAAARDRRPAVDLGRVGAANASRNQAATGGAKRASGSCAGTVAAGAGGRLRIGGPRDREYTACPAKSTTCSVASRPSAMPAPRPGRGTTPPVLGPTGSRVCRGRRCVSPPGVRRSRPSSRRRPSPRRSSGAPSR